MLNQAANVEAFIALVTKGHVGGEVTDSNHIHFNSTHFYMCLSTVPVNHVMIGKKTEKPLQELMSKCEKLRACNPL